jgi:hypothetical protein
MELSRFDVQSEPDFDSKVAPIKQMTMGRESVPSSFIEDASLTDVEVDDLAVGLCATALANHH